MTLNTLPENVRARIEKLYALSKKGVDGERDTAERFLQRMLSENNLTEADLELVEERRRVPFAFSTTYEKELLLQIWSRITDNPSIRYGEQKNKVYLYYTRVEEMEARVLYSIYRRDLKEHLKLAYDAFVQANRIFNATPRDEQGHEQTQEEWERTQKMLRMARGIDASQVNQQVEG